MLATGSRAFFRFPGVRKPLPLTRLRSVRCLTDSTPKISTSPRRGTLLFAVLSSSLVSGVLGYSLSTTTRPSQHDYLESPKYGSPREFKEGIKELRKVFAPRDIISTDPEVLEIHGVSTMNSYHQGL